MSGVRIDTRQFDGIISAFAEHKVAAVRNAALAATLIVMTHTVKAKLTAANPPFLNRDTGHLVRTIAASPKARVTEDRAIGTFGSHLDYAFKHEFGGTFDEQIAAHTRRSHTRRAHVRGGVEVRQTTVREHGVRAHVVTRTYRARKMLTTALDEKSHIPAAAAAAAMRLLMQHERPPTPGEIMAAVGGA
jgi:hypothetical protein